MNRSRQGITRTLFIAILSLSILGCLSSRSQEVSGTLHGELVWQGEILIAGDVVLAEDVRLTILPGTRILFRPPEDAQGPLSEHPYFPGNELLIKGAVTAIGSPEQPIVFAATDPAAGAGSWGAINLEGSPEAIFEYCIFRQADSAVHSRESNVYIEQSVFEENLVGVRFHDSQILVEHNLFINNDAAVRFHFDSPVICENEFVGNNVNLFITSHPSGYHIENNTFGIPAEYHVVFGEEVPEDVKMSRNFWLIPEDSTMDDYLYDGRRSDYLGRALIEPMRSQPSDQAGISWKP